MVIYLQNNLPLQSTLLKDVSCLAPNVRNKEWTVNAIGRLAAKLPHMVSEREVSLVKDQWKLYQAEDIPEEWHTDILMDVPKRLDHYWAKVLKIKSESGTKKYSLLSKVVKSCLSLHNGNASVERSLSDNKNTLTSERTKLSDEALMGLRKAKEHARSCGGAHNVNTLSKGIHEYHNEKIGI